MVRQTAPTESRPKPHLEVAEGRVARIGLNLAHWSEKWFPDPLVFAFLGVIVVYLLGVVAGESPVRLGLEAGKNFWTLVPFTMQMVMVIIGGYVVASTPLVRRGIYWIAGLPKTPRAAITLVAFVATTTSLISWGLSPIISGFLVREMTRRIKGLDYRAAGTAAYLGTGSVWALGLSSSAAMLMATKSAMPTSLFAISGLIPLAQTLFLWQSITTALVIITTSVLIAYFSAPSAKNALTAESFGLHFDRPSTTRERHTKPGEWLEFSPLLNILMGALLLGYLLNVFLTSPQGALAALDLNIYNLMFLTAGLFLHGHPRNFVRAVTESIPATGSVLIQFPFYAMIFGMIVGTGLSGKLALLFIKASTHDTFALLAAGYSAVLGLFIPSGGSKWIVEAPYVLQAAIDHKVHLGWVVQIYNVAEALPNLVNPFWMLPLLGILRLKARHLVGYSILYLVVQLPVVFFLCWFFARSLAFVPPMK
jgi:short-chain fatty acids transporter